MATFTIMFYSLYSHKFNERQSTNILPFGRNSYPWLNLVSFFSKKKSKKKFPSFASHLVRNSLNSPNSSFKFFIIHTAYHGRCKRKRSCSYSHSKLTVQIPPNRSFRHLSPLFRSFHASGPNYFAFYSLIYCFGWQNSIW